MRLVALSSAGLALASMIVWVACSNSSSPSSSTTTDGGPTGDSGPGNGIFTLGVPCTNAISDIYGDPGTLPADKGDIIKCAVDSDISMADLYASAKANLSGDAPPRGEHRVLRCSVHERRTHVQDPLPHRAR